LNDSGDSISLIDPNGDIVSSVHYDKSFKGLSCSVIDGEWKWTTVLTPGYQNILKVLETDQNNSEDNSTTSFRKQTITEARGEKNGKLVLVEGKVTAPPATLSDNYFYIQDDSSGIQIYSYHKNFPKLMEGDSVKIIGEISEISGEKRIKIKSPGDIIIISNTEPFLPLKVELDAIGENLEGKYVEIEGFVSKTSGQAFFIKNSAGEETKVLIKNKDVKKPKIRKGYKVTISGVVSRYKNGYRILPFKQENVKILPSDSLPQAGVSEVVTLTMGIAFYLLCNLFQKMSKKRWILAQRWRVNLWVAKYLLCQVILEPEKPLFQKVLRGH
jgi:DNA/RNA endonuclease YhcR with UshA esterase domain